MLQLPQRGHFQFEGLESLRIAQADRGDRREGLGRPVG